MFAPDPEKVTVRRSPERGHRYRVRVSRAIAGSQGNLAYAVDWAGGRVAGPVSLTPSRYMRAGGRFVTSYSTWRPEGLRSCGIGSPCPAT